MTASLKYVAAAQRILAALRIPGESPGRRVINPSCRLHNVMVRMLTGALEQVDDWRRKQDSLPGRGHPTAVELGQTGKNR